jgi:site-specific recombinase XerD
MRIKGKEATPIIPTLYKMGDNFYIVRAVNGRKRQLYLRGIHTDDSAKHMVSECDIAVVHNRYEEFAAKFAIRKSISLQGAADEWVRVSKCVTDNRPKVIRAKERLMQKFVDHCSGGHLSAVTQSQVCKYIELRNKCVRPTTAKDDLTKLRTFFRFCVSKEWISKSPAEGVKGPRASARTQDYVHVVDRAELESLTFVRPVYKYIVWSLWYSGLRIEELYRVRLADVHDSVLHVRCDEERTKSAKGRQVDICCAAKEMLRKAAMSDLPHPETVRKVLRTACKRAKVAKITPHQLRHSRASLWYAEGVPKKNISVLLGHSSTEITENYLHPVSKETINALIAARRA